MYGGRRNLMSSDGFSSHKNPAHSYIFGKMAAESTSSRGKKSAPASNIRTVGIALIEKVKGITFGIEVKNIQQFLLESKNANIFLGYGENEHMRVFMIYGETNHCIYIDKDGIMRLDGYDETTSIPKTARFRDLISHVMLDNWKLTEDDLLGHEIFDLLVYRDEADRC